MAASSPWFILFVSSLSRSARSSWSLQWPNYTFENFDEQMTTSPGPINPNRNMTHNFNFVVFLFLSFLANAFSLLGEERGLVYEIERVDIGG